MDQNDFVRWGLSEMRIGLGSKLPVISYGRDGHHPYSSGLYTHYKDSPLKVGWPSPILGVQTLVHIGLWPLSDSEWCCSYPHGLACDLSESKRLPWVEWDCYILSRWWFERFFIFTPIWGRFPLMTNIFQRGWNHQPVIYYLNREKNL